MNNSYIESVKSLCKEHGFTVSKSGNWLWLNSTDGRYEQNEEYKILKDIGFNYSENKKKFYYKGENKKPYNRYNSIIKAYRQNN